MGPKKLNKSKKSSASANYNNKQPIQISPTRALPVTSLALNGLQDQDLVRALSKEIIDDRLGNATHELSRRILVVKQKETELMTKIWDYEKKLELYQITHSSHRKDVPKLDAIVQTD